ncbi:MAG: hypothetical protein GEV11_28820 [Streptosporangiales bacterium]|nr:hypothetical protein [Streptosporangiales bacterium]
MGWHSHTLDEKEREQARYLPRVQVLAMSAGVSRFSWYAFMDTTNPARSFGMIANHPGDEADRYRPKPSYAAYAVMTARLSGLTHDSREPGLGAATHSHLFSGGEEELRVMWHGTGSRVVDLTTREPLQVTDLLGRVTTHRPGADGVVGLTLTENPQYVSGDVRAISAG